MSVTPDEAIDFDDMESWLYLKLQLAQLDLDWPTTYAATFLRSPQKKLIFNVLFLMMFLYGSSSWLWFFR
jgi:hypothetical protein